MKTKTYKIIGGILVIIMLSTGIFFCHEKSRVDPADKLWFEKHCSSVNLLTFIPCVAECKEIYDRRFCMAYTKHFSGAFVERDEKNEKEDNQE